MGIEVTTENIIVLIIEGKEMYEKVRRMFVFLLNFTICIHNLTFLYCITSTFSKFFFFLYLLFLLMLFIISSIRTFICILVVLFRKVFKKLEVILCLKKNSGLKTEEFGK